LYLSLLSFHRWSERSQEQLRFFEGQWTSVDRGELEGVIGQYARVYAVQVVIHLISSSGKLDTQVTINQGGGGRRLHLLLVPNGLGGEHCLPLGRPDFRAQIQLPAAVAADIRGAPGVEPIPEQRPVQEVADQATSSTTTVPGQPQDDADDFFDVQESESLAELRGKVVTRSLEQVFTDQLHAAARALGKKTYRGVQPPPKSLGEVEWRGGWMPSQCPKDPNIVCGAIMNFLVAPDFASATLDNFVKFGTSTKYCEVRFKNGLQVVGRRTVSDGKESQEFFTAGDSLHCGSDSWCVQQDGDDLLQVVPATFGARCKSLLNVAALRTGSAVHATAGKIECESLAKAKWAVVCLTNKDPVETAVLTRMRGDAAKEGYTGLDAEASADIVRVLASRYRTAGNVSGPYGWGGCYSCGAPLAGKMRQRICKHCTKRNTTLGRMIAEGCKVTSAAVPIRYPGVVWTQSRHPPLKPGVETIASAENFPTPHRA
jgi:hypothetical protein